jgi:hypothetical protein
MSLTAKELFKEKELPDLIGLSASKLRQYRTQRINTGQVPESFRVGGRVFYHRDELIKWMSQQSS